MTYLNPREDHPPIRNPPFCLPFIDSSQERKEMSRLLILRLQSSLTIGVAHIN